jgi:hypothetical protein
MVDAARLRQPPVLLTRLFLRQFLENDLISPDADRTQLLAVVGAMFICLTLFISVFISFNYVVAVLSPGQVAVMALDDRFFFIALAMIIAALVAASQWDALAIDPRDAAILEPLPVAFGTIRRAKLAAVAILGAAVAIALNACPSVVFPWLLVFNFRQLPTVFIPWMIAVHAVVTFAAAVFGYLVIIALRETLAGVLGVRWFTRVSPWAQGLLIVVLGSALLLLPPSSSRVAERGFDDWRGQSPPMWFLGAYEVAVGNLIINQPRADMTARQATRDRVNSELYAHRQGQFPALARRAVTALGGLMVFASAAYMFNAWRVPALAAVPPAANRRRWRLGDRMARAVLVRDSAARAGFYFTLAAMWRSNTHRLTLACAAAAGFAMAVLALSNANPQSGASPRLLAMQPLLYGALLVGFRHVIRVPAELRANWGFQLAWRNRERAFAAGVRRAAVIALVLPALIVLLPLFVYVLGPQTALIHAALGLAGAIVFLEVIMVNYDKVPFTCTYVPTENMKALGPIYAITFFIGASMFARMQYNALQSGNLTRALLTLAVIFVIARVMSLRRARLPYVEFDEAPATYQRLGLHT